MSARQKQLAWFDAKTNTRITEPTTSLTRAFYDHETVLDLEPIMDWSGQFQLRSSNGGPWQPLSTPELKRYREVKFGIIRRDREREAALSRSLARTLGDGESPGRAGNGKRKRGRRR